MGTDNENSNGRPTGTIPIPYHVVLSVVFFLLGGGGALSTVVESGNNSKAIDVCTAKASDALRLAMRTQRDVQQLESDVSDVRAVVSAQVSSGYTRPEARHHEEEQRERDREQDKEISNNSRRISALGG